MKIGMAWFDNNTKKGIPQVIQEAWDYYKMKYAKQADCVVVNIDAVCPDFVTLKNGFTVTVYKEKHILPNNYWIGVKDEVPDETGVRLMEWKEESND